MRFKDFQPERCAQRIRIARHAKGWSMKQAARESGDTIPEQYWSKWENAHASPSAIFLFTLAQILEVPVDYLLGLTTSKEAS